MANHVLGHVHRSITFSIVHHKSDTLHSREETRHEFHILDKNKLEGSPNKIRQDCTRTSVRLNRYTVVYCFSQVGK